MPSPARMFLLGLAFALPLPVKAQVSGWRADIDTLVARIERVHPRPWAHISREAFQRQADALRAAATSGSEAELLAGMVRLTASLEDGHTYVSDLGPAGSRWFPVRFHLFGDGLWITAIAPEQSEFAGARVMRLGQLSAEAAVKAIMPLAAGDNEFGRRERLPLLANAALLEALGIVPVAGKLTVTVAANSGARTVTLDAIATGKGDLSWPQYGEMEGPPGATVVTAFNRRAAADYRDPDKNGDLPLHLRGRRAYWWTVIPNNGGVYLQVNNIVGKSRYSPFTLLETLRQALAHADSFPGNTPRFILDLRYNSGGDGSLNPRLAREFIRRDTGIAGRGRLFVLTGGKTFSAAADLAIMLMRHTPATFAGEPMGVPFNASGDAGHSKLENHEIGVSISTNTWMMAKDDSIRVVPVQIPVAMTGERYFAGSDPVLDAILSRPAPFPDVLTTLREQGGTAAKALWESLRREFGSVSWWRPFTMNELNSLSYDLLGRKRIDDAIAGFELNRDRFPTAWETWDSLGDAYKEAGRRAEARSSYERALRIAPDNWNAEYQRKMIKELAG